MKKYMAGTAANCLPSTYPTPAAAAAAAVLLAAAAAAAASLFV